MQYNLFFVCTTAHTVLHHTGVTTDATSPAKRKVPEPSSGGNDDVMSDAQKKVFMSRKERKVFESLRKAEDAKAAKAETLRKKKMALAK